MSIDIEKDVLKQEELVSFDIYGDGYWPATITSKQVFSNRVQVSYLVNLDLNAAGLKIGKTIVVQNQVAISSPQYSSVDYGRFIISNISFTTPCDTNNGTTTITVYDGIHGTGISPFVSSVNIPVNLYFSDDSVSFDAGNVEDLIPLTPYKRYFEIYVDGTSSNSGHTATHERARFLYTGALITNINFYNISPKFAGYRNAQSNASPNVIRLNLSYNNVSGIYDGYLSKNDFTNQGNIYSGKIGEITRFYDNTNIDYIDFTFDINQVLPSFSNQILDIDIFPSLVLDEELMPIGSCQVNDLTKIVNYVKDDRQFGNVSEEQLSDSAIDFIQSGDRYLHQNGVLSGFSITNTINNTITITGGIVFVNGKILNVNNNIINIPLIQEIYLSTIYQKINYLLCVNEKSEFVLIALTDFDAISPATPNAPNRILSAINPLNSNVYNIESRQFIDVINIRKDLTVLYKISSVVSNTGTIISLSTIDARKFSFQTDANIFPVLTDGNVQGSFNDFDALAIWLMYNTNLNDIEIKGNFSTALTYSFNTSTNNSTTLYGNNTSTITFLSGSNITFENFNFIDLTLIVDSGAIVNFINCYFDPTTLTINSGSTISINNCTFNTSNLLLDQDIVLSNGGSFINSTITVNSPNEFIIDSDNIFFNGCTINLLRSNIVFDIIGDNLFFDKNTLNLNGTPSSMEFAGSFTENIFNWNATPTFITLAGNINVVNNQFTTSGSGFSPAFLVINDGYSGIISNNFFFRNIITLGAYIVGPATYTSGAVAITNNFFDSSTVNGTNQNLVSNVPSQWIYTNNLNTTSVSPVNIIPSGTSYTVALSDNVILINSFIAFSVFLPNLINAQLGRTLTIKDATGSASTNNITIHAFGSDFIDGSSSYVINTNFGAATLISTTAGWYILSRA